MLIHVSIWGQVQRAYMAQQLSLHVHTHKGSATLHDCEGLLQAKDLGNSMRHQGYLFSTVYMCLSIMHTQAMQDLNQSQQIEAYSPSSPQQLDVQHINRCYACR